MSTITVISLLNSSFLDISSTQDVNNITKDGDVNNRDSYGAAYSDNAVTYMLWQIVPPALLVLGCFGNVMTIVVMRAMRSSESIACLSLYFTALAVSDLFLLLSSVLWFWPEMAFDTPLAYFHDLSCSTFYFVCCASTMTSAWFLVAMTCQRMMSVILPHRVGILCSVRRGKMVIGTIIITSCAANIHMFFTYHVEYSEDGYWVCVGTDENIVNIFRFVDLCLASIIPFLFLIVGNTVLISHVVQSVHTSRKLTGMGEKQTTSRTAQTSSMTTTLIFTSLVFLLLTLPPCIMDLYLDAVGFFRGETEDEHLIETLALADTVCLFLWISSSVFNFYIYILSGSKFREETRRCFRLLVNRPNQLTK